MNEETIIKKTREDEKVGKKSLDSSFSSENKKEIAIRSFFLCFTFFAYRSRGQRGKGKGEVKSRVRVGCVMCTSGETTLEGKKKRFNSDFYEGKNGM